MKNRINKVIYAIGSETSEQRLIDAEELPGVYKKYGIDFVVVLTKDEQPAEALRKVLDQINANQTDNKTVVIYRGTNLHLLAHNLSCDKLDLDNFRLKLIEVAGGYETPQQQEIVNNLFLGGLHYFTGLPD